MENASKALLIAGGVLVALLVISLGMFIIGRAKSTSVSAEKRKLETLTQEQVNKFSQYSGTIYGSEVENCVRRVYTYNKDKTDDEKISVFIDKKAGVTKPLGDGRYPLASDIINNSGSGNGVKNIMTATDRNDLYKGTISYRVNGTIEKISFELSTKK